MLYSMNANQSSNFKNEEDDESEAEDMMMDKYQKKKKVKGNKVSAKNKEESIIDQLT